MKNEDARACALIRGTMHVRAAGKAQGGGVRFKGVAYRGGELSVAGFDRVVVDLDGLNVPEALPIASDHRTDLDARLGTARATVERGTLIVEGSIVPGAPGADRAIALLRDGGMSLSIGARPGRVERVAKGATVEVNGKTFAGPIDVARDSTLVEVSAVGVGADEGAVAVAAKGESTMADKTNEVTNDVRAERERVEAIDAAFNGLTGDDASKIRATAIKEGWPIEQAQREALGILRAQRPNAPGVRGVNSEAGTGATLAASAAKLLGASDDALDAAKLPRPEGRGPSSLLDIAAESLRIEQKDVPASADRIVRAAFSTDSFAGTLATALSVVGLEGFRTADEPAMTVTHRVPLPDFKAATLARLNGVFTFQPLGPSGELKHGEIRGDTTPLALKTKGAIVRLTREAVINDDRQLLSGVPRELGREAARSIGDALNEKLSDAGGTFFTSARGNLMDGGTSVLGVDSLTEAIKRMRTMKDNSGRALNLPPRFLLVGADLEALARSIVNSTELGTTDGSPRGNPLLGAAEVLVDARIAEGEWFLMSAPENAAAVLATLRGVVAPTVEALPPESETLGIGWRAWLDYAVALHEWRGVIKSLGT